MEAGMGKIRIVVLLIVMLFTLSGCDSGDSASLNWGSRAFECEISWERGGEHIRAVLICGALFSLYHQNPAQTIYQFCCGAAFALVAMRSGSVLPTVLAHFVNNAVILILTKFGVSEFSAPVFITIVVISAVCLVLSLVYLVFLDENKPSEETPLRETEIKTERKNFWICAAVGIAVCVLTWLLVLVTGM